MGARPGTAMARPGMDRSFLEVYERPFRGKDCFEKERLWMEMDGEKTYIKVYLVKSVKTNKRSAVAVLLNLAPKNDEFNFFRCFLVSFQELVTEPGYKLPVFLESNLGVRQHQPLNVILVRARDYGFP